MVNDISPDKAKSILADITNDKLFYVVTGSYIKNLYELENSLVHMSDETFSFHVNQDKNDFYEWIQGVFEDKELLKLIKKVKNRSKLADIIKKRIETLEEFSHKHLVEKHEQIENKEKKKITKEKIIKKTAKKTTKKISIKPKKTEKPYVAPESEVVNELPEVKDEEESNEDKWAKLKEEAIKTKEVEIIKEKKKGGFDLNTFILGLLIGILLGLIIGKFI